MDQHENDLGNAGRGGVPASGGTPQQGIKRSKSGFPIVADILNRAAQRTGSAFRGNTTGPQSHAGLATDGPAAASSLSVARLKPVPRLTLAHVKSVQKAAKAFENFTLSKFAKRELPENYIQRHNIFDPKTVQDAQRELIRRQLQKLSDTRTRNSGLAITFPTAKLEELKKALPGIGEHGGEIKLDDLLTYLRGRMNGTTFYSRGNLVIKRLTETMQARSQARAIIERVKNGSGEKRSGTAQNGATLTAAARRNSPNEHVPELKGPVRS